MNTKFQPNTQSARGNRVLNPVSFFKNIGQLRFCALDCSSKDLRVVEAMLDISMREFQ